MLLWEDHAGRDDPRTLASAERHIATLINMGLAADAEELLPDVMSRFERRFGADDLRTLQVRRGEAIVHMLRGRSDEAQRILMDLRAHPRLAADDDMQC